MTSSIDPSSQAALRAKPVSQNTSCRPAGQPARLARGAVTWSRIDSDRALRQSGAKPSVACQKTLSEPKDQRNIQPPWLRPVRILSPGVAVQRLGVCHHLATHAGKVSGPEVFRKGPEFMRDFKVRIQRRHLGFRILRAQPGSSVSVGHVLLRKICATFPRVSEGWPVSHCDFFSISSDVRSISRTSLWSRIFNIRVLIKET